MSPVLYMFSVIDMNFRPPIFLFSVPLHIDTLKIVAKALDGQSCGPNSSRLRYEPQGWNLSFQARIWALRLEFGPQDWDWGLETGQDQ